MQQPKLHTHTTTRSLSHQSPLRTLYISPTGAPYRASKHGRHADRKSTKTLQKLMSRTFDDNPGLEAYRQQASREKQKNFCAAETAWYLADLDFDCLLGWLTFPPGSTKAFMLSSLTTINSHLQPVSPLASAILLPTRSTVWVACAAPKCRVSVIARTRGGREGLQHQLR